MVVITNAHATKRTIFNDHQELPYKSLYWYITTARKCCGFFHHPELINDEDAISFIVEELVIATNTWTCSGGMTFKSFLMRRSLFAIGRYIQYKRHAKKYFVRKLKHKKRNSNQRIYSLFTTKNLSNNNYDGVNNEGECLLDCIPNSKAIDPSYEPCNWDILQQILSTKEFDCLSMSLRNNMTLEKIGNAMNFSREAARQNIERAIIKIRTSRDKKVYQFLNQLF